MWGDRQNALAKEALKEGSAHATSHRARMTPRAVEGGEFVAFEPPGVLLIDTPDVGLGDRGIVAVGQAVWPGEAQGRRRLGTALPLATTTPCSAIAAATIIHRTMLLIMIGAPAGASAAPTARRGRGDVYSTTAAEAAGAAVSQVLLAALAGGRRNGRERGDGQGQGENNLRHRSSPLGSLCSGGSSADGAFGRRHLTQGLPADRVADLRPTFGLP